MEESFEDEPEGSIDGPDGSDAPSDNSDPEDGPDDDAPGDDEDFEDDPDDEDPIDGPEEESIVGSGEPDSENDDGERCYFCQSMLFVMKFMLLLVAIVIDFTGSDSF